MEGFRGHDCAECLRDGAYVVRFEEGFRLKKSPLRGLKKVILIAFDPV